MEWNLFHEASAKPLLSGSARRIARRAAQCLRRGPPVSAWRGGISQPKDALPGQRGGPHIARSGKIPIFVPEKTGVSNTIRAAAVGGAAAARTGKVV